MTRGLRHGTQLSFAYGRLLSLIIGLPGNNNNNNNKLTMREELVTVCVGVRGDG